MTPKDWDKIEKMLEHTADRETMDAVKALVESMKTSLQGSLTANVVKSIQRGIIMIPQDKTSVSATIQAVDTSKAFVSHCGVNHEDGPYGESNQHMNMIRLSLTNATTITATRYSGTNSKSISYEVIEFY